MSGQEKKRIDEMMPAVLLDEQRQLVSDNGPCPNPAPDQVFASRRIVGPDGETQAWLLIAPAPPGSSQED